MKIYSAKNKRNMIDVDKLSGHNNLDIYQIILENKNNNVLLSINHLLGECNSILSICDTNNIVNVPYYSPYGTTINYGGYFTNAPLFYISDSRVAPLFVNDEVEEMAVELMPFFNHQMSCKLYRFKDKSRRYIVALREDNKRGPIGRYVESGIAINAFMKIEASTVFNKPISTWQIDRVREDYNTLRFILEGMIELNKDSQKVSRIINDYMRKYTNISAILVKPKKFLEYCKRINPTMKVRVKNNVLFITWRDIRVSHPAEGILSYDRIDCSIDIYDHQDGMRWMFWIEGMPFEVPSFLMFNPLPHVSSGGKVCFGENSKFFWDSIRYGDLLTFVSMLNNLVQNYDNTNPYSHIYSINNKKEALLMAIRSLKLTHKQLKNPKTRQKVAYAIEERYRALYDENSDVPPAENNSREEEEEEEEE